MTRAATNDEDLVGADLRAVDTRRASSSPGPARADAGPAVAEGEELLEHERDADGRDQGGEAGCVAAAEPAVGDALHAATAARPEGTSPPASSDEQRPDEGEAGARAASTPSPWMTKRGEDAEDEDLGVGEVDQPQDAVDERVAERDQGVDRAQVSPSMVDGPELVPRERRSRCRCSVSLSGRVRGRPPGAPSAISVLGAAAAYRSSVAASSTIAPSSTSNRKMPWASMLPFSSNDDLLGDRRSRHVREAVDVLEQARPVRGALEDAGEEDVGGVVGLGRVGARRAAD